MPPALKRFHFAAWPCLLLVATVFALAACATKKDGEETTSPSASPTPSPTSSPSPSPSPEPSSPTPQTTFRVTVSSDSGETEERVFADGAQVTPTPSSSATVVVPIPSPSPSPTPSSNFFSRTWQKIFPPKPTAPAAATPPPAKKEGIFSRMWHSMFPKKVEPPAATAPTWIGTVKLVNTAGRYVLVDTQTYYNLATGEQLIAVGSAKENATLRVSADRNPPFFIADIVSGSPQAGDRIYSPKP